jgi:DNA-binding response OmpR family regulator
MRKFEVIEAQDNLSAMNIAQGEQAINLALVEWNPREIHALEFIAQIRQNAASNATIILMADVEPAARELHAALLAGADNYLMIPFTSQEIDERLVHAGFRGRMLSGSDRTGLTCR